MNEQKIKQAYDYAVERYAAIGVDVEKAMEPLFTTRPEYNRSGMGFAFMEAFMDDLEVVSEEGQGTVVKMQKKIGTGSWIEAC